ncbi:MAG: isoprenylcysteine carboxylmethyltransferase family protein [Acidobacteria bacterium]|nr:MAG: isoprenylcysteine carboxylmethyltransferase family protein [Acidobacteriota bacterium]
MSGTMTKWRKSSMRRMREWAKGIAAQGGTFVFFIMAFEVMIMISPFAFFFYSVFNPIFHWLDAYPMTRWLTHFFLPHMILPPTVPLKIIRITGSVLFIVGSITFTVCALQVYLGKILKWGIATRGLYRFVRHPQYTSLGLWGVGMAILWPRFIVLVTLSIMFILYYFLAKDEERRMIRQYGDSYKEYMRKTGMFFPRLRANKFSSSLSARPFQPKTLLTLTSVVILVIGTGFVCRIVTLNSLRLQSKDNVTLVSIMPEDSEKETAVLNAMQSANVAFLDKDKTYLGYVMPVDYIMQGMIANTGSEHQLYKQHHTIGLIADWVLHPFGHLRRPPSAQMAKMRNVDPAMARRHHCPLGINNPDMDCGNCEFRRIIFVEVDNSSSHNISGKEFFAFNARRIPVGLIDISIKTGKIINKRQVEPKTAWGDVPTPEI